MGEFLYQRVYEEIKEKIISGVYKEGDKLPSDAALVETFGVSIITIKKALNDLKAEGLVRRVSGIGTIVGGAQPEKNAEAISPVTGSRREEIGEKIIGLVIEHVSSYFGLDLLYHLDIEAKKKGYRLITRFSYYDTAKETEELEFLLKLKPAGLIVMPCHGQYYNPTLLKLILEGFPIVLIDKKMEGISVPSVRTDNTKATYDLVMDAYNRGCRKIGFVSPLDGGTSSLKNRHKGYFKALNELGLESEGECAVVFENRIYEHVPMEENVNRIEEFVKRHKDLDALVCAEYSLIPAVIDALEKAEIKGVYVSCIDGPAYSRYTHMRQNEGEIAQNCLRLLLNAIQGYKTEEDVIVEPEIKKAY